MTGCDRYCEACGECLTCFWEDPCIGGGPHMEPSTATTTTTEHQELTLKDLDKLIDAVRQESTLEIIYHKIASQHGFDLRTGDKMFVPDSWPHTIPDTLRHVVRRSPLITDIMLFKKDPLWC